MIGDNESLCETEPCLGAERCPPQVELEPGTRTIELPRLLINRKIYIALLQTLTMYSTSDYRQCIRHRINSENSTVKPLYYGIRYYSKIRYNVNPIDTKISGSCIFSLTVPSYSLGNMRFGYLLESPLTNTQNV